MPSNLEGKNFVSKFPGYCPQNTMVFFSSKLDGIKKYFCRQYLQNLNALIFWFKYLQKVNAMPSDFWWKKNFASLTNNFWSFKNGIKNFHQQNLYFFIRNLRALHLFFAGTYIRIWRHLFSAGIALQLYSALRFERLTIIYLFRNQGQ